MSYLKVYLAVNIFGEDKNLERYELIVNLKYTSEEYATEEIKSVISYYGKNNFLRNEIDFDNLNKHILVYEREDKKERYKIEYELKEEIKMLKLANEKNQAENIIFNWLEEEKAKDQCLNEKLNVREFTTKELLDYCCQEARKQAIQGSVCIADETVFEWCKHYILEGLTPDKKKTAKAEVKVSKTEDIEEETEEVKPTEEEKPEMVEVVVKKKISKPKKAPKPKEEKIAEGQMSIFDFM